MNNKTALFKRFIHYGKIVKRVDKTYEVLDFTTFIIDLDYIRGTFDLCNGHVIEVHLEVAPN